MSTSNTTKMITNNEFVSRVVNNLKALTKDGHISKRFILSIGKIKAKFLIAQKLDEMTLFREDGIITSIPCFEMQAVEVKTCDVFEFRSCARVMKSTKKLPEGIFGKNGSGIISVTSVDELKDYSYITPQRVLDLKKRKYTRDTTRYYTIKDGYLYLPDSTNELLELRMIALDKQEAAMVSSCSGCNCDSVWEYEFVCPDRFMDLVIKDTLQEVGSIYRTSVEDANPNMEPNQKTQTIQ